MALLIFVAVGAMALAACGSSVDTAASSTTVKSSTSTKPAALKGTITVSAAASLTEVFADLGKSFEAEYPGTKIEFNFASSGVLETQLEQGAPADVFASADEPVMARAQKAGVIQGAPTIFARNTLVVVVRPGNPLGIESLADLKKADVVALCATSAPCGALAEKLLDQARVELETSRVTRGQNVKATLQQLTVGDADAALVYVTDARTIGTNGDVVEIPSAKALITDYPIAAVKSSKRAALAEAWIAFVVGPEGRAALESSGFLLPS